MSFGKNRPPLVPDPGQQVDLLAENGQTLHGFRVRAHRAPAPRRARPGALPPAGGRGGVVVGGATEAEFRDAKREGRPAVSMPWPAGKVTVHVPWGKWQGGVTGRHRTARAP